MRKLIIVIGLLQSSIWLFGERPPIIVQAVCEITKIDGTTIRGYMKIGVYDGNEIWMDGFLSYTNDYHLITDTIYNVKPIDFTVGFKSIELRDGLIIATYKSFVNLSPLQSKLKYVSWKSKPSIDKIKTNALNNENARIVENDYELSDSVMVYHNLDQHSCIILNSRDCTYIAIRDILKFSFPEKDEILKIPGISGDFRLPIWYHNIMNKKD